MTIDQLSEKRKKLRKGLIDNEAMDGFKELLTVLYSDKVHFIYELLQNAEDARATEVQFVLNDDRLEFEHNGDRLFKIKDVKSITTIGSSTKATKADDVTSIGEFGIGFKSVFAYTATPEIESGDFHFRIHDMFVPDTDGLAPGALGEKRTRFVFPFDNPDRSPKKANEEIETKLRQLNENALLFLSNIRKIEYHLPDSTTGFLERKENANDENRIEISVMRPEDIVPEPIHYLRFEKVVSVKDEDKDELKKCRIAIAFGMDKPGDGEWKIIPLNQGQVCIYFPAVKETSKLRFHLHAPFASTVARDSVRECSANDELRNHLAELIAESMHTIRDQGLLNVEFLKALPNSTDDLLPFYLPIQKRLIEEFNTEKLTPMKRGSDEHAAASGCYRGQRMLSDLIIDEDLATLFGKDRALPMWIANPPRLGSSREDNFLTMLDISEWTTEDFVQILNTSSELVMEWLKEKPDEWHQDLYVLLGDFLSKEKLSNLRIVRCSDGEYRTGSECHFLDDVEFEFEKEKAQSEEFHYVAKDIYSFGQNKNQQQKAREFLEKIGVCEVDESERVKAILKQRYEDPDTMIPSELHEEDMKRFIALVEQDPDKVILFKDYRVFRTADRGSFDEGFYHKASIIFLDSPYLETGLKVYYEDDEYWEYVCTENIDPYLSLDYEESDIDLKKLGKFAEKLGAKTRLTTDPQSALSYHPESNDLGGEGGNWTDTGIDKDYRIPEFQILLDNLTIAKSALIWQSMLSIPPRHLKAEFRWNQKQRSIIKDSSLVYDLKDREWVPQKDGDSVSYVSPRNALCDLLPAKGFSWPKGYPDDAGEDWLKAIEFGKIADKQQEENAQQNQNAKGLGFNSADEANTMAEIANVWREHGKSPEESLKKLHAQERRKELLIIELGDAGEKIYKILPKSTKVTGNTIDPRTNLKERYTTDDNKVQCQMCSKGMPFKKRNSDEDYFEAVEALGKGYFFKEHEAQYLALCPECAAEYKEYVKRDPKARETFHDALKNSDSPQIHLELPERTISIWFEDKHWQDLKTVLYYYENIYNSDETD